MLLPMLHFNAAKAPGQGTTSTFKTLSQYRAAGYKFHFLLTEKSFDTFYRLGWRPENPSCILNVSPSLHLSHCLSYQKALSYLSPLCEQCKKLYNPTFEPQDEAIELTNLCLLIVSIIFNIYLCTKQFLTRPPTLPIATHTIPEIEEHRTRITSNPKRPR